MSSITSRLVVGFAKNMSLGCGRFWLNKRGGGGRSKSGSSRKFINGPGVSWRAGRSCENACDVIGATERQDTIRRSASSFQLSARPSSRRSKRWNGSDIHTWFTGRSEFCPRARAERLFSWKANTRKVRPSVRSSCEQKGKVMSS